MSVKFFRCVRCQNTSGNDFFRSYLGTIKLTIEVKLGIPYAVSHFLWNLGRYYNDIEI